MDELREAASERADDTSSLGYFKRLLQPCIASIIATNNAGGFLQNNERGIQAQAAWSSLPGQKFEWTEEVASEWQTEGIEWIASAAFKRRAQTVATLAHLARQGKLCTGDTEMAELLMCGPSKEMTDIQVDGIGFVRDGSGVRQWEIAVWAPRNPEGMREKYVGSIIFPPDYPSCAPILIYAERMDARDLCGTIIKNARIMEVWINRTWVCECADPKTCALVQECMSQTQMYTCIHAYIRMYILHEYI